mmetsp:Transcript_26788/g.81050  ORF Transcript_26788/g.81050 Transcript_26788/m.81050 type:complete len:227 (-) Transcript_26788:3984-4664(-)
MSERSAPNRSRPMRSSTSLICSSTSAIPCASEDTSASRRALSRAASSSAYAARTAATPCSCDQCSARETPKAVAWKKRARAPVEKSAGQRRSSTSHQLGNAPAVTANASPSCCCSLAERRGETSCRRRLSVDAGGGTAPPPSATATAFEEAGCSSATPPIGAESTFSGPCGSSRSDRIAKTLRDSVKDPSPTPQSASSSSKPSREAAAGSGALALGVARGESVASR